MKACQAATNFGAMASISGPYRKSHPGALAPVLLVIASGLGDLHERAVVEEPTRLLHAVPI